MIISQPHWAILYLPLLSSSPIWHISDKTEPQLSLYWYALILFFFGFFIAYSLLLYISFRAFNYYSTWTVHSINPLYLLCFSAPSWASHYYFHFLFSSLLIFSLLHHNLCIYQFHHQCKPNAYPQPQSSYLICFLSYLDILDLSAL